MSSKKTKGLLLPSAVSYGDGTAYGMPVIPQDGRYARAKALAFDIFHRAIRYLLWLSILANFGVMGYGLLMQHEHLQVTDGSFSCLLD